MPPSTLDSFSAALKVAKAQLPKASAARAPAASTSAAPFNPTPIARFDFASDAMNPRPEQFKPKDKNFQFMNIEALTPTLAEIAFELRIASAPKRYLQKPAK